MGRLAPFKHFRPGNALETLWVSVLKVQTLMELFHPPGEPDLE